MSKNLIPEICKLLGVKPGEEFKIKGYDGLTYKLTDNGLELTAVDGQKTKWFDHGALSSLLKGKMEIVKLPWKPKEEEIFYSFYDAEMNGILRVANFVWGDNVISHRALYKAGWVYRTREEAEAALPSVATEMGVEYEL